MIKYDAERAMRDFQKHLIVYIQTIRHELLEDARQGMRTSKGKEDLSEDEIKVVTGIITTAVVGGAWATMDEHGTGSRMDLSNPVLQEYFNSQYWNPARTDIAIRGRPAGRYTNIFGETKTSSGRLKGLDLERMAREGKLPSSFLPKPPSHALETAQRWMMNGRFQWMLSKAITSFPWGKYLIVTNTKG